MFTTTVRQITALGLAAATTLALLGSIDHLATESSPQAQFAAAQQTPLQVVVITGKRLPRG
jgi:hypothetical protein